MHRSALLETEVDFKRLKIAVPGHSAASEPTNRVSTGIAELDSICAGFPRGGITEICGNPSSGLTTVLCACAHAPAQQGTAEADPVKDELTRLRQESATVRRRVQMLEDRMLQLERGGVVPTSGKPLPTVKLGNPAPAPRQDLPADPVPARRSIKLEPVPAPAPMTAQSRLSMLRGP